MPLGEIPSTGFALTKETALETGGHLLVAGAVVLGGIWMLRKMYEGVVGKKS